jgi:2-iminoacetate synthase
MVSTVTFSQSLPNAASSPLLRKFEWLLAPKSAAELEEMARRAQALTRHHFGRTMRLFAPLYLSNECINSCQYCGFSRENAILRVTLEYEQMEREARHLAAEGFRNLLLVAGEHPKFVSNGYLEECTRRLAAIVPGVSLEVAPMETHEYEPLVRAGAEGLVVYQETYHRPTYAEMHVSGPKKNFDWRLDCPERAYAAGFRRLGLGALLGLHDWRAEALGLARHVEYLLKHCWKAQVTVSFPRLKPCAGEFQPLHAVSDRDYAQLLCAMRQAFPQIGIVLSTREEPALRDALLPLGITMMSAGSHTEPGGYTGEGRKQLHHTVRGKIVELENLPANAEATEQFAIGDHRSPLEVATMLRQRGLEPVWKDWDAAILQG